MNSSKLSVLFCDPYGSYLTWVQELKGLGVDWEIDRVDSLANASEFLAERTYDAVVVATLGTPERELVFMRTLMSKHPQVVRILFAPVLTPNLLSRSLDVAHRVCFSGAPISELIPQLVQAWESNQRVIGQKVKRSLAAFKQLPSPPSVFNELTRLMNSEQTTASHIANVVAKDPALSARLIRIVNSSYFGLVNRVSSIQQAVSLVGVRTLRGLALSGHFGRHYKQPEDWEHFSVTEIQTRALLVARLAQQLARSVSRDPLLRDQAFLSGLLLDIGMLMLAAEQPSGYSRVIKHAAKKELDVAEVEQRAFGVSHAQLGAALLNQWNVPPLVVDAILYHHRPVEYAQTGLTPVALAHVADALIPPLRSAKGLHLNAQLDHEYLERSGVSEYLPKWRMEANAYRLQSERAAS